MKRILIGKIGYEKFFMLENDFTSIYDQLFNLDYIYDADGFNYWVERSTIENFLKGKAFDYVAGYTEEEMYNLKRDIMDIYLRIIAENPIKEHLAILTAGGPGAGKTVLLNQDRDIEKQNGRIIAYICSDDVALRQMSRTYQKDVKGKTYTTAEENEEVSLKYYNKWRPGSNGAAHIILANLIKNHYAFYFGTTSTTPQSTYLYEMLQRRGYKIKVLHLTAAVDVRLASVAQRNKVFVQTNGKDLIEKGELLVQRISDTYLKFSEIINFYYREHSDAPAFLAAIWIAGGSTQLQIINREFYDQIKRLHDATCEKINREDLLWEMSIEKTTEMIEY